VVTSRAQAGTVAWEVPRHYAFSVWVREFAHLGDVLDVDGTLMRLTFVPRESELDVRVVLQVGALRCEPHTRDRTVPCHARGAPQFEQVRPRGAAHDSQNVASGMFSWWQRGQVMSGRNVSIECQLIGKTGHRIRPAGLGRSLAFWEESANPRTERIQFGTCHNAVYPRFYSAVVLLLHFPSAIPQV